jgi:tetratricopeptide (TPR) repeat protein
MTKAQQPAPSGPSQAAAPKTAPADPGLPGAKPGQRLTSVFSKESTSKIGTGTTARTTKQIMYFYAQEREDGKFDLQALSPTNVPFGPKTEIGTEELLKDYMPEPQKYNKEVLPAMREVTKLAATGDRHRLKGETFSAEFEYGKALKIDVENVRANFGIGLCYLSRGDKDKARQVFERVCGLEDAFASEYKHLFNEFGINLRKQTMFDEAVVYYQKALGTSPGDENIHYNIARAAYAKNDLATTKEHLKQCLTMNPQHPEAGKFVKYLRKEAEARKAGKG